MSGAYRVVLVQPPFVQLNSPYPAPYYLKSFLEAQGQKVTVLDHSIGLFERIFSRPGLTQIFSDAEQRRLDKSTASVSFVHISIIERFLSEKEIWIAAIERLVAFLRGKDPEWGHFLALANGCIPGGPRVDAYLADRGGDVSQVDLSSGDVSPDESRTIATMLLADLADFVTCTLDQSFSLIRYTPIMEASSNTGLRDFAAVQKKLRGSSGAGYIMDNFYRPMLNEEWEKLEKEKPWRTGDLNQKPGDKSAPFLLGLSVPFPGCLVPALVCAESAKKYFGSCVRTVIGGGYVNTELRFLGTKEFFDYFDYVSFDRGYGSLAAILEHLEEGAAHLGGQVYKTMYRFQGAVVAPTDFNEKAAANEMAALENKAAGSIFPDYGAVDFGRYLYPVDDTNPMHRLWSDGHWLKAYLAYGCYWHSCAFCDVTLDYIRNFIPVDPAALFFHLKNQAEKTGCRGIHFCDEAAPASSLLEFALLNREAGLPLNFWGNIRFESGFNPDTAAILAAGGLLGVSAGLEVVTEKGFQRLGKGIGLESAINTCAAFKEAGILTHAYLIYGYWDEDEQEIVDSAETLRQLFAQRLLDSAFWHKFILPRHSRIYAEKQRGLHPALEIKDDPESGPDGQTSGSLFALNDLSFAGENKFDKYSDGLDRLLQAWMAGDTDVAVEEAFPFKVKRPSVPPNLVAAYLNKYAIARDGERKRPSATEESESAAAGKSILFLGSIPRPLQEGKNVFLRWRWRLVEHELRTSGKSEAEKLAALLESASRGKGLTAVKFYSSIEEICRNDMASLVWKQLREGGLVWL